MHEYFTMNPHIVLGIKLNYYSLQSISLLSHKDGLVLFMFVNSNDLVKALKSHMNGLVLLIIAHPLTSDCLYVSRKLRQGLNERENCVRIDAGLNSLYLNEI